MLGCYGGTEEQGSVYCTTLVGSAYACSIVSVFVWVSLMCIWLSDVSLT